MVSGGNPPLELTVSELNSLREALVSGIGWSYLPAYAVKRELESRELKIIPGEEIRPMHFGVWWNKNSRPEESVLQFCMEWLKVQTL